MSVSTGGTNSDLVVRLRRWNRFATAIECVALPVSDRLASPDRGWSLSDGGPRAVPKIYLNAVRSIMFCLVHSIALDVGTARECQRRLETYSDFRDFEHRFLSKADFTADHTHPSEPLRLLVKEHNMRYILRLEYHVV